MRVLDDRRFRFLLVGGFNIVQGVGWFALLYLLLGDWLPYPVLLLLAYIPAILIGFVLYRVLVFKVVGHVLRDLARFTLVQVGAFCINVVSLPFFHEVVGIPMLASQTLSIGVIIVFNYTGHLLFSFRRKHGHGAAMNSVDPHKVVSSFE